MMTFDLARHAAVLINKVATPDPALERSSFRSVALSTTYSPFRVVGHQAESSATLACGYLAVHEFWTSIKSLVN